MMIGNLLRVKDLPTNGEDSSRARAPHHLSIANTKKRPPRRRETKKATARSQREREREREKQKKSAHLLLVMTRIGRHYYVDGVWIPRTNSRVKIQHASSSSPLSRAPRELRVSTFCFLSFFCSTSTTRPPPKVCPPRRVGGGVNNDGSAFVSMSSFFSSREKKRKTF